jgi:hypothetical protein
MKRRHETKQALKKYISQHLKESSPAVYPYTGSTEDVLFMINSIYSPSRNVYELSSTARAARNIHGTERVSGVYAANRILYWTHTYEIENGSCNFRLDSHQNGALGSWSREIPSDNNRIRHVPRRLHYHEQSFQLEARYLTSFSGRNCMLCIWTGWERARFSSCGECDMDRLGSVSFYSPFLNQFWIAARLVYRFQ